MTAKPYSEKRWDGAGNPPSLQTYSWSFVMAVSDEGFAISYTCGDFSGEHYLTRELPELMQAVEVETMAQALFDIIAQADEFAGDTLVELFLIDRIEMALVDDDYFLMAVEEAALEVD